MMLKKDVLTTGQVAEICNVAPRTVTKWFDDGRLGGYRIPGSRDRRIPVSELITFMKTHDIPTDRLEKGKFRILIVDSQVDVARRFANDLVSLGSFEIACAHNSFDAGLLVQKFTPNVILIDLMSKDIDASYLCHYVRSNMELTDCAVIALAGGLSGNEAANLKQRGYSDVVTDLSDTRHLLDAIQNTCAILH